MVALWACSSHRLSVPEPQEATVDQRTFRQSVNHKLDVLFMVDDSLSMNPLQVKMSKQLGTFMDILVDRTTGQLPDMHVAVVSSSFGSGAVDKVGGCPHDESHPGNDGGKFRQGPGGPGQSSCAMLHGGARFLDTGDGDKTSPNYEGDIREAFKCIALLGDKGCGFESQFKAVMYALDYAHDPKNEANGGFLRDDAVLAIVMVTNEDDCSVGGDSLLLFPGANSKSKMDAYGLGAQQNYRCNEFGHLCAGQPPPHGYPDDIPADGVTLNSCVSAEDDGPKNDDLLAKAVDYPDSTHGHLWPTVKDFSAFIKSLKPKDRENDILVAAIAGPVAPYKVVSEPNVANGEMDPVVSHSCVFPSDDPDNPEYADPAVRINQWTEEFGNNGLFFPICAPELKAAMQGIANKIHEKLGSSCVSSDVAWNDPDDHGKGHKCVVERGPSNDAGTVTTRMNVHECLPIVTNAEAPEAPTNTPCFQLLPSAEDCKTPGVGALFRICETSDCKPSTTSSERLDAAIQCRLQ